MITLDRPRTPKTPSPTSRDLAHPSPTWSGASIATLVDETGQYPQKHADALAGPDKNKLEQCFDLHDLLAKDP